MLFDKIDLSHRESNASPNNFIPSTKHYLNRPSKLPKIAQIIGQAHNNSACNIRTPKSAKVNITSGMPEKSFYTFEDISGLRVPKISARNIPDVFIPPSQGSRRLKIITSAIKEKGIYPKDFEKVPKENLVNQSLHRPKLSAGQNRSESHSFISPIRPELYRKRNSVFHQHNGELSIMDSFTYRTRMQSITPTPFLYDPTDSTIGSPKNEYYGVDRTHLKPISKQASEKSSAHPSSQIPSAVTIDVCEHPKKSIGLDKQIKKLFMLKKIISKSKSPETLEPMRKDVPIKPINLKDPLPTPILQLNELITIKKIKTTITNGVIKRMLHAPSFRIFDIQEEPILELKSKETHQLKDWLQLWKKSFQKSQHLARVYSCFWNYPEGCVSVLLEPAKQGYLSDVLHKYGSLPEHAIQKLAKELLEGIIEIHEKTERIHGNISPSEIMLDSKGSIKIAPGISHQPAIIAKLAESAHSVEEKFTYLHHKSSIASNPTFAQDVFDLGLTLLACAIGEFDSLDLNGSLTPENIKLALDSVTVKKNHKHSCCLLHSENIIKKALGFIRHSSNNLLRKSVLKNNFSIKHTAQGEQANQSSPFSIVDMLRGHNRFSDSFIDFLCLCLKLDPSARADAQSLLHHEFLSDSHHSLGPLVTLEDILRIPEIDTQCVEEYTARVASNQIEKIAEALHVVFLNKEVKMKFELISSRNPMKNHEDKKIVELAQEIDVESLELWAKLVQTLFLKI